MAHQRLTHQKKLFAEASRWVDMLVAQVGTDAETWERPGLGEWDLRALVGHTSRALLTVEQYLAAAAEAEAEAEDLASPDDYFAAVTAIPSTQSNAVRQRGVDAGAALGADPVHAFHTICVRVLGLVEHAHDQLITTPAGGITLSNYLPTRAFELVVHGLDIARATEHASTPPEEPLKLALDLAVTLAQRSGRGADVLLALTGRHPLEPEFSIV